MIIKKWSGSTWEAQSPQVTYTDIVNSVTGVAGVNNGNPLSIFNGGKLRETYLPDSIFSGLTFVGGISRTTGSFLGLSTLITGSVTTGFSITSNLDTFASKTHGDGDYGDDVGSRYIGHYWVSNYSGSLSVSDTANSGAADFDTNVYDDGIAVSGGNITVERGDWIVITGWDDTNERFKFSVISNTTRNATTAGHGIVMLSEADNVAAYNSETNEGGLSSGSDKVLTEDQLLNFMGTGANNIAYGAHAHGSITSDGKIGSTAGLMLKTTTDGAVTTLAAGNSGEFLTYNGTWATPAYTTNTNTTYQLQADLDTDDEAKINLIAGGSGSGTQTITLIGGTNVGITQSQNDITISAPAYTAGNGISLDSNDEFSVANGQGLTQEPFGLAMTYPIYHGDTLPTLTSATKYNNVIGFEW